MTLTDSELQALLDNAPKKTVKVEVYRCCTDSAGQIAPAGTYLGDVMTHDPSRPGDGPWYLKIEKQDAMFELGFGTKAEALTALAALPQYYDTTYEVSVEPWDD